MSRKERPRAAREPRRRSGAHSSLLALTPRVPHREPWQPSPYARLVGPVLLPEQARQRGLFIPDDERVRGEEDRTGPAFPCRLSRTRGCTRAPARHRPRRREVPRPPKGQAWWAGLFRTL